MARKLKRVEGVTSKKRVSRREARECTAPVREPAAPRDRDRGKVETRRLKAAKKARAAQETPARKSAGRPGQKRALGAKGDGGASGRKRQAAGATSPRTRKKAAVPAASGRERTRKVVSPKTVVPAILVAVFIALSASPVASNLEAQSRLRAMKRELTRERKTTKSLQGEMVQARSMEYIEQEARRQRLVAPGEVLILVTTDSKGPEVWYRLKALQSIDEAWERVRQMLHCGAERHVDGQ